MIENDESNSLIRNENPSFVNQPITNNNSLLIPGDNQNGPIDTDTNFRATFIQNVNDIQNDINIKTEIPQETIHTFTLYLTALFTLSTVQAIIPQIVIIISKNKIDYYSFFSSSYWVLIVLVAVLVGIALTVFFLKKNFLGHQIALSIPLFIVYIMVVTLISTFASFYSVELALGVSICQLIAFASMLLLDLIKQMRDKYHIKLMIEYVIILIGFIVYCCVVKKQIVGCFIYLTFLMLFCTYMIFEFRHMLFEFVNTFKLSCEKEISIMVYAVAMMNSNVDILMCCFK